LSGITYRAARAADVPRMHALLQALSDHDGTGLVGSPETLLHHGFGPRPLFQAVLAEVDGAVAGLAIYFPDYSTSRGQPGVYVQDVVVDAVHRGHGIGRRLLAEVMTRQDWGAAYMTLGVGPDNASARAFYAALGFRPRGYDFLIAERATLGQAT
jgi:ribosomal protein S18 acetylase RimI-like enzyme